MYKLNASYSSLRRSMNSGLKRSPVRYSGRYEFIGYAQSRYAYQAYVCLEALGRRMQENLEQGYHEEKRSLETFAVTMGWMWRIWVDLSCWRISVYSRALYE